MGGAYGRDLKRIRTANGCHFVRHGKGDQEISISPMTELTFTVDAGTRKRFTANAILKQAGIDKKL